MNKQQCPQCHNTISVPLLRQYDDSFDCPHCHSALSHNEIDIILYALSFISLFTPLLMIVFSLNVFIAIAVIMLTYHLLRPVVFERFFRIRLIDQAQDSSPANSKDEKDI